MMTNEQLKLIIEGAILAAGEPLTVDRIRELFLDEGDECPSVADLKIVLEEMKQDCESRCMELKEVASGFSYQVKAEYSKWVKRLWQEKAPRYSRALMETLAVMAYRQPVTRADIEDIRGVSVSSNIIKTLLEREWIKVVGQREIPGRPSVYATTKQFLDYFNLKSLEELPLLPEPKDLEQVAQQLEQQLMPEQMGEVATEEMQVESEVMAEEMTEEQEVIAVAAMEVTEVVDDEINLH